MLIPGKQHGGNSVTHLFPTLISQLSFTNANRCVFFCCLLAWRSARSRRKTEQTKGTFHICWWHLKRWVTNASGFDIKYINTKLFRRAALLSCRPVWKEGVLIYTLYCVGATCNLNCLAPSAKWNQTTLYFVIILIHHYFSQFGRVKDNPVTWMKTQR